MGDLENFRAETRAWLEESCPPSRRRARDGEKVAAWGSAEFEAEGKAWAEKFCERGFSAPTWPEPPDPAAFHGVAGEFVRIVEPHTEADPVALLVQFLTAFGNIIGRTAFYRVEADHHHGKLFVVLVGEPAHSPE